MQDFKVVYEEFKILGKELVEKVGEFIREGNVRRASAAVGRTV
jgi:hypothetical protein